MQKRPQEDLKFVKTNPGAQKLNTSFSLPEIQWIKHFAPNIGGKEVNRANHQVVDPHSYSSKSIKRERCCYSKESTSQAQPSSSSQNGDGYGGTFVFLKKKIKIWVP